MDQLSLENLKIDSPEKNTQVNEPLGNASQELPQKKYKYLVLDTNPLLKGDDLSPYAEKFVTISEVLGEIVSKQARDRLDFIKLKLDIEELIPDSNSINTVIQMAKQTGDFNSLSITDIKVISLALMLNKQAENTQVHENKVETEKNTTEPVNSITELIAGPKDLKADEKQSLIDTKENTLIQNETTGLDEKAKEVDNFFMGEVEDPITENVLKESEGNTNQDINLEESGEEEIDETHGENGDENDDGGEWTVVSKPEKVIRKNKYENVFGWGGEWITPENINKAKLLDSTNVRDIKSALQERTGSSTPLTTQIHVGTVTSDFAMQNVLLNLGLNLVSLDGYLIKELKTWVMRCHACFATTPKMDVQFCPSCGHTTMIRTSVSTFKTKGGQIRTKVHLKKNFQYKLQGTKFSIPTPVGGRSGKDIITRADDKRYTDSIDRRNILLSKMERQQLQGDGGLWDVGYIPTMLIGSQSETKSRNGEKFDTRGMPIVGFGRKNPNKSKKTGNRKKKNLD
ncbi:hypothetical protein BB558_003632 [Smittium angustum]|uniref:20S-pre-rRNA D-site endonuclease NOB1 n=1 Tax=Smittium angustum TaxID=133377 RepID=A0A2U1J5H0_SMIAN|nr:hypothetical protein BB558_003632 [Smittium angustum]